MDQLRVQIEAHKDSLRKGIPLPTGRRGSGRTQAILEYAHEVLVNSYCDMAIVCATPLLAHACLARWQQLYGTDAASPVFITELGQLRGRGQVKVLEDPAGVCFVCGCTEFDPCLIPATRRNGEEYLGACSWANQERTLCTNPACLEEAFACPVCGISVELHSPFMEAGCQIRATRSHHMVLS